MKRNAFDNMTILPSSVNNINENTVYEDTGIDFDSAKKMVFSKIGSETRPKKKILRMVHIAAAVMTLLCVFSLPVVAENLYVLYGSIIGGDSYTGDFTNVKNAAVKFHDPDLKLESLKVSSYEGINDLIDIRISKKSGKKFADNTFNVIKNGNFSAWFSDEGDSEPDGNHQLEMIIDKSGDRGNKANGLGYSALYGTENEGRILHILISINITGFNENGNNIFGGSLQGKNISIKSYNYLMASVDSVLGSFEKINDESISKIRELENYGNEPVDYDIFTNSYYYHDVVYNNDKFDAVKGRIKYFSLPFEISFTMDCDISGKASDIDDAVLKKIFTYDTSNGKLSVSPSGISVYAKTSEMHELPDMKNWYILTKDGNKYYICAHGCSAAEKSIYMNCIYKKFPNNSNSNYYDKTLYLIDPENISEIVLNGITVLKK